MKRLRIYMRDKFRCQYCGQQQATEDLTFDHVVPRSRGGRTTWENICTCCGPCTRQTDSRTPEEAGMRLLRKPTKPRYLPIVTVQMDRRSVPADWQPYWQSVLEP